MSLAIEKDVVNKLFFSPVAFSNLVENLLKEELDVLQRTSGLALNVLLPSMPMQCDQGARAVCLRPFITCSPRGAAMAPSSLATRSPVSSVSS